MKNEVLKHYQQTGPYTYPGAYKDYFKTLPSDIKILGHLVCSQVIHPITLLECKEEMFPLYGDLRTYPKYRMINEDDIFQTAVSMTAELFRLNEEGFVLNRAVKEKIVVTCRYVSVLMCAILKSKDIPCRSRAGFFSYWPDVKESSDHWINEYWNEDEGRWTAFDADGFYPFETLLGFSQYDIPKDKFAKAADVWLGIREGRLDGERYIYSDAHNTRGLNAAVRQLFYDYHALMNHEVSYHCLPSYIYNTSRFKQLSEAELQIIDELAHYMLLPDENYSKLKELWLSTDKFRIMCSPLIEDIEHLR